MPELGEEAMGRESALFEVEMEMTGREGPLDLESLVLGHLVRALESLVPVKPWQSSCKVSLLRLPLFGPFPLEQALQLVSGAPPGDR